MAEWLPVRAMKVGADDLSIGSVWSPWPSADRPLCKDAASSLEEALKSTLAAWSHCTRRPLIERSEEHTSELQSLMRISYAVFCLTKNNHYTSQYSRRDRTGIQE